MTIKSWEGTTKRARVAEKGRFWAGGMAGKCAEMQAGAWDGGVWVVVSGARGRRGGRDA